MQDVMNVNQKEYKIVKLLGHGKGGYSYLAEREGKFYVLKQIHHEPCEYYSFGNKIEAEQNDYNRLLQTGIRIPRMLDIDVANERILKSILTMNVTITWMNGILKIGGLSTGLRQRNLLIIWSSISYVTQDFVQSKSLIILKTC